MEARGSSKSQTEPKKRQSKMPRKPKDSVLEQKSPAEFFAENKNIAGFDNVCEGLLITVDEKVAVSEMTVSNQDVKKKEEERRAGHEGEGYEVYAGCEQKGSLAEDPERILPLLIT
ncbi:hypothetical protein ACFX13_031504 [Malus domestica]